MSIAGLLTALILIAIVCVIVGAVLRLVPMPAPVGPILWALTAVLCLLILLGAVTGHGLVIVN